MTPHLPILILLPLLVGALLAIGLGLFHRPLARLVALATNLGFVLFAGTALIHVLAEGPIRYALAGWPPPFGIELVADPLSAFIALLIATIGTLVLIYGTRAIPRTLPGREVPFFSLALTLELGLTGMVLTGDLFNLYVFLEIASLAAYALMAVGSPLAPLSAFRYLLAGALGGALYLMGIGFLYLLTGSLNMADIAVRVASFGSSPALLVSLLLVVAGLGLKMALFPMHSWLPDAYTHASATATALIAPLMTKVAAYALIRLCFFVYMESEWMLSEAITTPFAWLAATGILFGAVMAMGQRDLKRMLAYSSISQIGLIGLGIGMATPLALIGAILHIANHALMKGCLFLAAGAWEIERGKTVTLGNLAGAARRLPWMGAAFTTAALAMVGLPPTVGFFSKWYLVWAGIEAGRWPFVIIILGSSLLTAVYLFRVIEILYTRPHEQQELVRAPVSWVLQLPTVLLALASLVIGSGSSWLVTHLLSKVVGHV